MTERKNFVTMLQADADELFPDGEYLREVAAYIHELEAAKPLPRQPTTEMFQAAIAEGERVVAEIGGGFNKDQMIHFIERYYQAMWDAAGSGPT